MPRKFNSNDADIAIIGGGLVSFLDLLVQTSLERIEAQRSTSGRGPSAPAAFDRQGAADYLAVGTTTLDRLKQEGKLKTVKIAGMPRYTRAALDRYIRQQEQTG